MALTKREITEMKTTLATAETMVTKAFPPAAVWLQKARAALSDLDATHVEIAAVSKLASERGQTDLAARLNALLPK